MLKKQIFILFFVVFAVFKVHAALLPEEATRIGVAAYIYGYPLISMEMTRQMMTNVVYPNDARAPMGQFAHIRQYPKASFKYYRAPDTDILASHAWVDLQKEPYILHIPEVKSRDYLFPLINAWSEMFACISPRTHGREAHNYALTGPEWKGTLPLNVTEIKSPTNLVWITGRTHCSDSQDFRAVHIIQNMYSLKSLSAFTHEIYTIPKGSIDPSISMNSSVHDKISAMDVNAFFNLLLTLMQNNPGGPEDKTILKEMTTLGLVPGAYFSLDNFDQSVSLALKNVPQAALAKITERARDRSKLVNGWCIIPYASETENYLQRAAQAYLSIRVALPEDALFAFTTHDLKKDLLVGTNPYIIHFAKENIPPVHSFWSLAAYDEHFHLTPNALNRYNIHSADMLKYNRDGSLDIYVQHISPGPNKASNWLPVPSGKFILMFRLYRPKEEILLGKWKPPTVIIDPF